MYRVPPIHPSKRCRNNRGTIQRAPRKDSPALCAFQVQTGQSQLAPLLAPPQERPSASRQTPRRPPPTVVPLTRPSSWPHSPLSSSPSPPQSGFTTLTLPPHPVLVCDYKTSLAKSTPSFPLLRLYILYHVQTLTLDIDYPPTFIRTYTATHRNSRTLIISTFQSRKTRRQQSAT